MDEIYLLGYFIALSIGFVKVGTALPNLWSLKARNFELLNLYYDFYRNSFTKTDSNGPFGVIFFLVYMLVLAPIFSWLSVYSAVVGFLHWYSKSRNTPEKIKELIWRIEVSPQNHAAMVSIDKEIREFVLGQKIEEENAGNRAAS